LVRHFVRNIDAFRTLARDYIARNGENITPELLGTIKCAEMSHTDFDNLFRRKCPIGPGLWFDPVMITYQELERYEKLREENQGLNGDGI